MTKEEIYNYWLDSPIFQNRRQSSGPDDWGDERTIGCHVMLQNATVMSKSSAFGIYLGKHGNQYIVATFDENMTTLGGGESFDSIEEMKNRWRLD